MILLGACDSATTAAQATRVCWLLITPLSRVIQTAPPKFRLPGRAHFLQNRQAVALLRMPRAEKGRENCEIQSFFTLVLLRK